ncbi:PREDICTED: antigen peptide transporter 1 [Nanorana parkeri]|uniref:antigen peptide transporter 1 n=1 Tax=Nanorana parkeri TaxID=125878 RepID=UPI0008545551|nr:PREDICTED: antigen peptide transporter 1 [Nanorana parkeri]
MHALWSLSCLAGVDLLTIRLLNSLLTSFLPLGLLLVWLMSLARFAVLTLGTRVVSRRSKLPSCLQGDALFIFCAVLSLLVPSCVTFTDPLLPHTSAVLLYSWGRWDLLLSSYLLTMTSGVILYQLLPSSDNGKDTAQSSSGSLRKLIALLKPYVGRFLIVAVFLVLSSWGEMALPSYTGKMTDWIQSKEDPSIFWNAIIMMSIITLSSALTEFFCDCIYNVTMSLVHTQTQGKVLRSVLRKEVEFFDTESTGDITSRVTSDITAMSESLSENLSLLMWYLMRLIFLVIYMLSLSPKLTLFTVLCLLVITLVPQLSGSFYQVLAKQVQESLSKVNQVALETFSNMRTVRSFANEEGECLRYETKLHHTYQLNKRESLAYAFTAVAHSFSGLALKVGILYFGGRLVTKGEVSGGELVSFVMYELQFTSAVEVLLRMYPDVRKAVGSSEKVFEYMDENPQMTTAGSLQPANLEGRIQFKNVSFSYPMRPDQPALQDVSFELPPGQVTALVGLCDAGKSTVVRLLLRFYKPQKGEILLDGKLLSEYENKYYCKKVSVVSQEPVLTARSLKDNISYGLGKVSLALVRKAAIAASADDFISEKENGYDTEAGNKGELLSGGQRQRIALARALLRDSKILILDDATSSLDSETQQKIQKTVLSNPDKRTILLITHRLNVSEKADHILVMEKGQIMESGNHEQLLANKGSYWKRWETQSSTVQKSNGEKAEAL